MTNERYNIPEEGTTDWHIPLNENFEQLNTDVEIRGTDSAREEYTPIEGSKYLATDTGTVYLGDGDSWNPLGSIEDSSNTGGTTQLPAARKNVGALVSGTYHANAYDDGGFGVMFSADDLYIDSVVVDSDLSEVSNPACTIELRAYEDGGDDPAILESTTVELTGGPERIDLGFQVPAAGSSDADENAEYVLQRGPAADDDIPLRRRFEGQGDWSEAAYAEQTYTDPAIDFIKGTINSGSSSAAEPVGSWYYFFDWLVGPEAERMLSPWSTDVEEIYMRPRDPQEEFDDVSPRALWVDTS